MSYRTIAIGLTLLVLIATVWYCCIYAEPLKISPETTYITAPLMSDGKRIDYFRAIEERLYPPEMKTDDNGYRMLVRTIGDPTKYFSSDFDREKGTMVRHDHNPEPYRLQVYEKLGLDPMVPPTIKIESDAGLDLLGKAVRKPIFYAPNVRENFARFGGSDGKLNVFRDFARAIQARAQDRIKTGNIDGVIDDTITCYLLARHVGKHRTRVDYLVGLAIESMAASIPIGGNPSAPPSRVQLQRQFDAIRALPPSQKIEDCLEAERLLALRVLQEYPFGAKPDFYWGPEYGPWCADVDWNAITQEINGAFESIITGKEVAETVMQRWTEGVLSEEERRTPELPVRATAQERTKLALVVLGSRLLSDFSTDRKVGNRRQCAENMKLLTLALLLYEKEYGKLPDGDWRVAVKPYLGENADTYFRCPSCSIAEDETTYAMIHHKSSEVPTTPYMLLLIEVSSPMKMTGNEGTIPASMVQFNQAGRLGSNHPGGCNVSYRNGAVAFITESMNTTKLQSLVDGTSDTPW